MAATKPLGAGELILRFGGAVEGGNRQDDCTTRNDETTAAAAGTESAPSEGADEPCVMLEDAAETAIGVAETTLENTYLAEAKEFKPLAESIRNMVKLLDDLRPVVCPNVRDQQYKDEHCRGAAPNPDGRVQAVIDRLYLPPSEAASALASKGTFRDVEVRVLAIQSALDEEKPDLSKIWALVVRKSLEPEPPQFFIKRLVTDLRDLSSLLTAQPAALVNTAAERFDKEDDDARAAFKALRAPSDDPNKPSIADKAKAQATREMAYPKRIIKEMLYETNLISFNPVAMFDVARVWRSSRPAGDMRYAAGGGLRMTLVSLDFTAGYAWNLRRRAGEGRGAFVFTMDVSNLFR